MGGNREGDECHRMAHVCARLSTSYTQTYGIKEASSKVAKAADMCSNVGDRDGGWYCSLGFDGKEGERRLSRTLTHILRLRTLNYTKCKSVLTTFIMPRTCAVA
jgi:hypothetical protein